MYNIYTVIHSDDSFVKFSAVNIISCHQTSASSD